MVKVSERRARDRKGGREEKREQHRTRGPDIRGQKGQIPQQSTNRERPPFMEPRNCRAMTGSLTFLFPSLSPPLSHTFKDRITGASTRRIKRSL